MERKKYKVTVEVVATAEIEITAESIDEIYETINVDDVCKYDIIDIDDMTILDYKEV